MNTKPQKRPVNGVLLLDKPQGISSNTALQKARRLYRAEKAGHTGVLDPLATGLLPVCFGEASSTGDAEGEIIATARADISAAEFQTACQALTGAIRQVPPMFSALKHEGRPLYEYARKGIVIERKARDITIYSINVAAFDAPQAVINVRCSKGTYIRTLSEDIAKHIGSFAHLTALRRTETAGFSISQTQTLEALERLPENERDALLLPCDVLVQHLPHITLDDEIVKLLKFGQQPTFSGSLPADTPVRAYSENGEFIGLVSYSIEGYLKAARLMNTAG